MATPGTACCPPSTAAPVVLERGQVLIQVVLAESPHTQPLGLGHTPGAWSCPRRCDLARSCWSPHREPSAARWQMPAAGGLSPPLPFPASNNRTRDTTERACHVTPLLSAHGRTPELREPSSWAALPGSPMEARGDSTKHTTQMRGSQEPRLPLPHCQSSNSCSPQLCEAANIATEAFPRLAQTVGLILALVPTAWHIPSRNRGQVPTFSSCKDAHYKKTKKMHRASKAIAC